MNNTHPRTRMDLAGDWRSFLIVWGLPIAALILSGVYQLERYIYPVALGWMGIACLANARRCGRLHCFITGPFFLALAALSLVHGLGVVPLGAYGWDWIGGSTLVGGVVLTCVPEMIWGKYLSKDTRAR